MGRTVTTQRMRVVGAEGWWWREDAGTAVSAESHEIRPASSSFQVGEIYACLQAEGKVPVGKE